MSRLQDLMQGRWRDALIRLGIDKKLLDGNGRPCPMCGGTDRFTYSDQGRGMWYCRGCGHGGDGVKLALEYTGLAFIDLAKELEKMVGALPLQKTRPISSDNKRQYMQRVWNESNHNGEVVGGYLRGRGIDHTPAALREHPNLEYTEKIDGKNVVVGRYPAMIAQITSPGGRCVGIHRTYLDGAGGKAPVQKPKKSLGDIENGSAIRLFRPAKTPAGGVILGVAEGIETALSSSILFNIPTWATISAQGMERFQVPGDVTELWIFADNDESRTGLAAASALAKDVIVGLKKRAVIFMPKYFGKDFSDLLIQNLSGDYIMI